MNNFEITIMPLKIMTFNIRYWNTGDKLQHWDNRKSLFFQVLANHLPDIIGFQEVLPVQMADLDAFLCKQHGYEVWAFDRSDGDLTSEGCPIFYRNLTPVDKGIFWLSKTPEMPSKHFGIHFRQCLWIRFDGPKPFVVMNTHLDHRSGSARLKGLAVLKDRIPQIAGNLPIVLMGDFNFSPESREYKNFSSFMADAYRIDGDNQLKDEITFHNFTGQTQYLNKRHWGKVINQRIDYFWILGGVFVDSCRIIFDSPSQANPPIYPSDHWPVLGEFGFW
jgi:endonuclease/exonuclease/phosphatase family metal-dependent hydrolase